MRGLEGNCGGKWSDWVYKGDIMIAEVVVQGC